ncbi:MAG: 50S ribosomal protein L29 [Deltaproteobacteria bacterium]|jgi:ribosomal protein L29|nr:50S ribosomal protein L29 [Deltaproteobacteria bacterium]
MKPSEIREMDLEGLAAKEAELRKKLFAEFLKGESAQPKTDIFKKLKKDIARIKTIVTEKKAKAAKEDLIKG